MPLRSRRIVQEAPGLRTPRITGMEMPGAPPPVTLEPGEPGLLQQAGRQALGALDVAAATAHGVVMWPFTKIYGLMALPFGEEAARMAEEEMGRLGYQPQTKEGREAAEALGKGMDLFLTPSREAGEAVKKVSPRLSYLVELGGELVQFALTGGLARRVGRAGRPKIGKPTPEEIALDKRFAAEEMREAELGQLEAPALPPGQGFVLKPTTKLRKGVHFTAVEAPKEYPPVYEKKGKLIGRRPPTAEAKVPVEELAKEFDIADAKMVEYLKKHPEEIDRVRGLENEHKEILAQERERRVPERSIRAAQERIEREVESEIAGERHLTEQQQGQALAELTSFFEETTRPPERLPPTKQRGETPPVGFEECQRVAKETGAIFESWSPPEYAPSGYMFTLTEKVHPVFKGKKGKTSLSVENLKDLPGAIEKKIELYKSELAKKPPAVELKPTEPKKAKPRKPTKAELERAELEKRGQLTMGVPTGKVTKFKAPPPSMKLGKKKVSGIGKQRDIFKKEQPELFDKTTLEFMGFQTMYEKTLAGIKRIRRKKMPRAISPEWPKAEMGRYETGRVVKHRKKGKDAVTGEDLHAPEIYEMEERIIKGTREPTRTVTSELQMETANRTFDQLGPEVKEVIYWPMVEGNKRIVLERKLIDKRLKALDKGMTHKAWVRVGVYGIAKQKGGLTRLKNMGFPEKKIPTKLMPNEQIAYQSLRKEFDIIFERANQARRLSGKQSFPKQPNYFTFMHDAPLLERMGFSLGEGKLAILNEQFIRLNTTPFRYAKARAKLGAYPMELNAREIFKRYSAVATKHIHLSPHIAKGRELLNTFGTKKAGTRWKLEEEAPRAAKFLHDWLNHQAGQIPTGILGKQVDNMLIEVNKNLAFAVLSANARSALIQPTAILHTAVEIGPKYTLKGAASIMDPVHGLRNFRETVRKSNHLNNRVYDVSVTDALQGIRRGKLGQTKKIAAQIGLKPLQLLDFVTAVITTRGAYMKAKQVHKMGEFDAIRYADDVVIRTQASAMPTDIAPIQRTALGKTLTLFNTFVINEWNWITRDILGIKNPAMTNKTAFKKILGLIVGATIVNTIYEDVIGLTSPYPSPFRAYKEAVERGEEWPSATKDALRELAEVLPIVGGALRYGTHPAGAGFQLAYELVEKIAGKPWAKPWLILGGKVAGVPGTTEAAKIARRRKRGEPLHRQILGSRPKRKPPGRRPLGGMNALRGLGAGL